MTLKLVPDAVPAPVSKLEDMTEEQLRAHFAAVRSERLDNLRENVRVMRTSEIIAYLTNPAITAHNVCDETNENEDHDAVGTAAMIVLADELDRRIPVPK